MPVKLSGGGGDHEEEARIEIVPLIDIMFFLLASFMLVSLSMTQIHRINVKVPQASTAVHDAKPPTIHLAIDAQGVTTWDTAIVTPTEITNRLKNLPVTDETRVLIAADEETRHKSIVAVIDAIRAAKVEKYGFETKTPSK
ncbi:biopolymer transporter ExbD [Luteolibacter ambystomatis]|uniref:Biopolymer transporter ExbD n=1 Tax=Luteolibacter ambystomatis TaxID=2824561 RepID=A0A975G6E9_9BACT|nr:biopolymer transporter ExbD [Luteolibacter ambystomatis]QUE49818.1 biopolymer transporter ExbD [Luteolibacter ambystomatis]